MIQNRFLNLAIHFLINVGGRRLVCPKTIISYRLFTSTKFKGCATRTRIHFAIRNPPQSGWATTSPPESETYNYKCEIDPATGTWTYVTKDLYDFIDTVRIDTIPDWQMSGDIATWTGEIFNYEDDMAGNSSDRCVFTNLMYKINTGNFQNISLYDSDLSSTDSIQWIYNKVNNTSFEIWDKIEQ